MSCDLLHGTAGGDQRLADYLAAEYPLPSNLRGAAAEQIYILERFKIEYCEQVLDG